MRSKAPNTIGTREGERADAPPQPSRSEAHSPGKSQTADAAS